MSVTGRPPRKREPLTAEQQQLVSDNVRLVFLIVNKIWNREPMLRKAGEKEDYEQEGLLAACRCAGQKSFDPMKAKFTSYMGKSVEQAVWTYALERQTIHVSSSSRYEDAAYHARNIQSLKKDFMCPGEDMGFRLDIEGELARMDPRWVRMFRKRYEEGKSYAEISLEEGISLERARQIVSQTVKKIRVALEVAS